MKLLKYFVIALFTITFVSASVAQTEKRASIKTKPPKKEWIEKEFKKISVEELSRSNCFNNEGEKIVCPCLTGELTCYKKGAIQISVKYDKKHKAREISLNEKDNEGYRTVVKLIFGELTKENYDKLSKLMQSEKKFILDSDELPYKNSYEDKRILVEHITHTFATNYVPQSYRIVWK